MTYLTKNYTLSVPPPYPVGPGIRLYGNLVAPEESPETPETFETIEEDTMYDQWDEVEQGVKGNLSTPKAGEI